MTVAACRGHQGRCQAFGEGEARVDALRNLDLRVHAGEAVALDSKRAGIVMDLLRKLASEQDACIIAATHDEKILALFDRLFHLRDGRLENDHGDKP